jgi:hypothetical protein
MGFTRIVMPANNVDRPGAGGVPPAISGESACQLVGVRNLAEALDELIT